MEAELDPNLKEVLAAPPLPEDIPPPPPREVQELIEQLNAIAAQATHEEIVPVRPEFDRHNHPLAARAMAYCEAAHRWLRARNLGEGSGPADPASVISWYSTFVPAKISRALHGLAWHDDDELEETRDHEGSAKVALIGIEESHAAWLQLVDSGVAAPKDVDTMIADLIWLTDELERLFPRARAFVRPVFDEPEVAARLSSDGA
jgi:hypothetical protein